MAEQFRFSTKDKAFDRSVFEGLDYQSICKDPSEENRDGLDDFAGRVISLSIKDNIPLADLVLLANMMQITIEHYVANTVDLEDEIQQTLEQKKELEKELASLKPTGGNAKGHDEFAFRQLKFDLKAAQDEIENFKKSIKEKDKTIADLEKSNTEQKNALADEAKRYRDLDSDLAKANIDLDEWQERYRHLEKEMRMMKEDVNKSQTDAQDYHRILKQYRDEVENFTNLTIEHHKEMDEAREENDALRRRIYELENIEQESSTNKLVIDQKVQELERQREQLMAENIDLKAQLQAFRGGEKKYLDAVNTQIQQWKDVLARKELQLEDKDIEIGTLNEEITLLRKELESTSIAKLQNRLVEQERRIKELINQRLEVDEDMRLLGQEIIIMQEEVDEKIQEATLAKALECEELKKDVESLKNQIEREEKRRQANEEALSDCQNKILTLQATLSLYERDEKQSRHTSMIVDLKEKMELLKEQSKKITQLVKDLNEREKQLTEMVEQNAVLRRKLGMDENDEVDIRDLRLEKDMELEAQRSVNMELRMEIKRLEEERLDLKAMALEYASYRGEQIARRGLSLDDMVRVGNYMQELKKGSKDKEFLTIEEAKKLRQTIDELQHDIQHHKRQCAILEIEKEEAQDKKNQAEAERDEFRRDLDIANMALHDLGVRQKIGSRPHTQTESGSQNPISGQQSLRASTPPQGASKRTFVSSNAQDGQDQPPNSLRLSLPSNVGSAQDSSNQLAPGTLHPETLNAIKLLIDRIESRSQIADRLEQLNQEIRNVKEINSNPQQNSVLIARLEESDVKIRELQSTVLNLTKERDSARADLADLQSKSIITLPDDLSQPTVSDVARLNEYLIELLADLDNKDLEIKQLMIELDKYKLQFEAVEENQQTLYREHAAMKQDFVAKERQLKKQLENLRIDLLACEKRVEPLSAVARDVANGSRYGADEKTRKFAQMALEFSDLRAKETEATRKLRIWESNHQLLWRECLEYHQNGVQQLETIFHEKVAGLEKRKLDLTRQVMDLQSTLRKCVPEGVHFALQQKHTIICHKYAASIEKERELVQRLSDKEAYEREVYILREQLAKERKVIYELEQKHKKGRDLVQSATKAQPEQSKLAEMESRVISLEAEKLHTQSQLQILKDRLEASTLAQKKSDEQVVHMEARIADLTNRELSARIGEADLRKKLEMCIPEDQSKRINQELDSLRNEREKLKDEVSYYRDLALREPELVMQKDNRIEQLSQENDGLKRALSDLQSTGKHQEIISRLNYELFECKIKLSEEARERELLERNLKRMNNERRQSEFRLYEKEDDLKKIREESVEQKKRKDAQIAELKRLLSGSLPLKASEDFASAIRRLDERIQYLENGLARYRAENERLHESADKSAFEVEKLSNLVDIKKLGLEEKRYLLVTDQMNQLRLQTRKYERQVAVLQQKEESDQGRIALLEKQLSQLERNAVAGEVTYERGYEEWELRLRSLEEENAELKRERELVRQTIIHSQESAKLQGPALETNLAARLKLDDALVRIRSYEESNKAYTNQIAMLKRQLMEKSQKIEEMEAVIKDKESLLETTQKPQRRMKSARKSQSNEDADDENLDNSGDRDSFEMAVLEMKILRGERAAAENKRLLDVAQSNIRNLQEELARKDREINDYQDRLMVANRQIAENKENMANQLRDLKGASFVDEGAVQKMRLRLGLVDDAIKEDTFVYTARQFQEEKFKFEKEKERLCGIIEKLRLEKQELETLLSRAQDDIFAAQSELKAKVVERDEIMRQLEKEKLRPYEVEDRAKRLRAKLDAKEKELAQLNSTITDLYEKMDEIGKGLGKKEKEDENASSEKTKQLQSQVDKLTKKHNTLKQQHDELKTEQEKLQTMNSRLEERNKVLEKEKVDLQDKLKKLDDRFNKLSDAHTKLKAANEKLERELEQQKRFNGDQDRTMSDMKTKIQVLQEGIQSRGAANKTAPKRDLRLSLDGGLSGATGNLKKDERQEVRTPPSPSGLSVSRATVASPSQALRPSVSVANRPSSAGPNSSQSRPSSSASTRNVKQPVSAWGETSVDENGYVSRGKEVQDALEKWELEKKWQKKYSDLRDKLSEKTSEVDILRSEVKQLRDQRDSLVKDRQAFLLKINEMERQPVSRADIASSFAQLDSHVQLSAELQKAQDELQHAKRVLMVEKDEELQRLRSRLVATEQEKESLSQEVRSLRNLTASGRTLAEDELAAQIQKLSKDIDSQKQISERLREDVFNKDKLCMELRFDYEQSTIETGRLKSRISDLERQIQLLREIAGERASIVAVSGKTKQPQSKTITELEDVIAAMKKVIEKQQLENEALRRRSDPATKLAEMQKENKALKIFAAESQKEIQTLRDKEAHMTDVTKQASAFGAKYENLYKAFKKEQDRNAKAALQVSDLSAQVANLQVALANAKQELEATHQTPKHIASNPDFSRLKEENTRLLNDRDKLKAQLDALGPGFFQEVSDLRQNYHESLRLLKRYESELEKHSKEYGFSYPSVA